MVQPQPEQESKAASARRAAKTVVRRLVEAGYTAYFAGGCVRDRLMGHDPLDYDIATDARPSEILQVFPRAQAVGESFGVMLVRHQKHSIEVATFRTEGKYSDGRHPDSVTFTDAQNDAQRRDFTINGMFEDPLNEKIIDYVGGQNDLKAGLIRAIGDPHARLREDRLRMLRAVRFAARFGFAIEEETAQAIREGAGDLRGVSRERIGQELRRMFTDPNRVVAAWQLQYLQLDHVVLNEPHQLVAPVRVGRLPDRSPYPTVLAAWLLDRHDPPNAATPREQLLTVLSRWAKALILSNAEHAAARKSLDTYVALRDEWSTLGVAQQKRLAASEHFQQGLALYQTLDRPGFVTIQRQVAQLAETGLAPEPLITGDDLIASGFTPGPAFKRMLDAVYDAQLEGQIHNREAALALAHVLANTDLQP